MVNTDLEIDLDEMLRVVTPRHRRWALYLLMEREIHTSSDWPLAFDFSPKWHPVTRLRKVE